MQYPLCLLVALLALLMAVAAFQPATIRRCPTKLHMGKGLNKFKSKQADLKRKMELAKQQKGDEPPEEEPKKLTDQEIKERNDRKRFEQLLKQEGSKVLNDYTSDSYLNTKQEEEEITAASKLRVVLFF